MTDKRKEIAERLNPLRFVFYSCHRSVFFRVDHDALKDVKPFVVLCKFNRTPFFVSCEVDSLESKISIFKSIDGGSNGLVDEGSFKCAHDVLLCLCVLFLSGFIIAHPGAFVNMVLRKISGFFSCLHFVHNLIS